jgi:hypothetical protein
MLNLINLKITFDVYENDKSIFCLMSVKSHIFAVYQAQSVTLATSLMPAASKITRGLVKAL